MNIDILLFNTISDQLKKTIFKKCGLNLSQTRLLLFFSNTDNQPKNMGELADCLHISLSTLSRQINQKKTLEFISVKRSTTDSSKILMLNSEGIEKASELKEELKAITQNLFSSWKDSDLIRFDTELKGIVNILNRA